MNLFWYLDQYFYTQTFIQSYKKPKLWHFRNTELILYAMKYMQLWYVGVSEGTLNWVAITDVQYGSIVNMLHSLLWRDRFLKCKFFKKAKYVLCN